MPNPYFRFKEFAVHHDRCAMKVGTDGCLLGAWASALKPSKILDIGAGTGLIGLMLAQRYQEAQIDLVEIEAECADQAIENVNNSPWKKRISVHRCRFQDYPIESSYDLIVSNPPYFKDAYAAPNENRHTARHDDSLSACELMDHASWLLSDEGILCLVLPTDRLADFEACAQRNDLNMIEQVFIKPTPIKIAKRILVKYSKQAKPLVYSEMVIEKSRGNYSEAFTKLLQDFYLYL